MKYQLTCPKCKHEFQYDNVFFDKNISRLGVEIQDIILQLCEHKKLPKNEQYARTDWWLSAKRALAAKQKELAELKALRKISDQQLNHYKDQVFRALVKELVGEEEYKRLIDKTLEELEAYRESGLMRHEYTRSNAKSNITSINKL